MSQMLKLTLRQVKKNAVFDVVEGAENRKFAAFQHHAQSRDNEMSGIGRT